jgi:hypothetical protein
VDLTEVDRHTGVRLYAGSERKSPAIYLHFLPRAPGLRMPEKYPMMYVGMRA